MYLKSVSGEILFEGRFHTIKDALEAAVNEKISLNFINLRHANLKGAALDGASLKGACLWGASLDNADLTAVDLESADCRNVNFKDSCLAESRCSQVDFRGSYFSRTILTHANFSGTQFSCPSLFNLNLSEVSCLDGAIYTHKGEVDCDISAPPITIHGLPKNIILMKNHTLIGHSLYNISMRSHIFSSFQNVIHHEKRLKTKAFE